jgi:hypothetical protein
LGEDTIRRLIGKTQYSNDQYWNVWIDLSYARGVPPRYVVEGYFELQFIISAENCGPYTFKAAVVWEKKSWDQPQIEVSEA